MLTSQYNFGHVVGITYDHAVYVFLYSFLYSLLYKNSIFAYYKKTMSCFLFY